jgi:hypothetical protein
LSRPRSRTPSQYTGWASRSAIALWHRRVYIRANDLVVERLEQQYLRVDGPAESQVFDYAAPAFSFEARLTYDEFGLVTTYPGIAARIA